MTIRPVWGRAGDGEDDIMRATYRTFRTIAVTMLVLMGLLTTMPLTATAKPGDNGGPGNSGAAHQCKQGGWQSLAREDGSGFGNQGECVSYGAQGGILVDVVDVPPAVSISLAHWLDSPVRSCHATISVSGFSPGTHDLSLVFRFATPPDRSVIDVYAITVDGDGNGTYTPSLSFLILAETTQLNASVDGVSSGWVTVSC